MGNFSWGCPLKEGVDWGEVPEHHGPMFDSLAASAAGGLSGMWLSNETTKVRTSVSEGVDVFA